MPEKMKINLRSNSSENKNYKNKSKSNRGAWALYLSVLALIISFGSGYLAVNSAYISWQLRTVLVEAVSEQQQNLDQLMSMRDEQFQTGQNQNETMAANEDSATPDNADDFLSNINIDSLFSLAPSEILDDLSGGQSSGQIWMATVNDNTFYRVGVLDLPPPEAGESYYLWQMSGSNSAQAYPIGIIEYDAAAQTGRLTAVKAGDWTAYKYLEVVKVKEGPETMAQSAVMSVSFPAQTEFALDYEEVRADNTPAASQIPETQAGQALSPELTLEADPQNQLLLQALMGGDLSSLANPNEAQSNDQAELLKQLEQMMGR